MPDLGTHATRCTRLWFWRSGFLWEVGFTVKKADNTGFCIGVQWPVYQRCRWTS